MISGFLLQNGNLAGTIIWSAWVSYALLLGIVLLLVIIYLLKRQIKVKTSDLKFKSGILQSANTMLEELLQDKKNAELNLKESEQVFDQLFSHSPNALLLLQDNIIVDCNLSAVHYLAYENKEQVIGKTPWDFSPEYQPDGSRSEEKAIEIIQMAYRTGSYLFEWMHRKADGNEILTEVVITMIILRGRQLLHVSWHDISEQSKMQKKLKENEEKYRLLIEHQTDLIVKVDVAGKFLFVSPSYCQMFGKSQEELLGNNFLPLVHPDDQQSTKEIMKQLYEPPFYCKIEQRAYTVKGWKWISWVDTAVLDEHGQVKEIIGVGREITDQKNAEIALKQSEQRWQFALEGSGDGVWDWNVPMGRVYYSDRWKELLGYSPSEIGDDINEWVKRVHPDDLQSCFDALNAYFNGSTPLYIKEHRMLAKDGTYRWILDRGKILERNEAGEPLRVIGTHTDITDLKQIQEELLTQNVFIQTVLDNLPIGVAINNIDDGKATYMNQRFTEVYGWPQDQLNTIDQFFENVYPDSNYRDQKKQRFTEDIKSGDPDRMKWMDITIRTQDGQDRVVTAINIPLPLQNVMVSTVQDMTHQKMAELELKKLTQELEQKVTWRTQQLQASYKELEAFSYSVSHDLKAPLRAITGFAEIIEKEYKEVFDEEGIRLFQVIRENANTMNSLINNLLELSRTTSSDIQKSKVNMLSLAQKVFREITNNKKPVNLYISEMPECTADFSLIRQVWFNLLSNAIKFSLNTKNPTLEVGGHIAQHEVIYYVKDNGVGFNPDQADKIFEVFQRLHSHSDFEGSGLGLAIVQRIILRHQGRVWAESTPGNGAVFYFSLPLD